MNGSRRNSIQWGKMKRFGIMGIGVDRMLVHMASNHLVIGKNVG